MPSWSRRPVGALVLVTTAISLFAGAGGADIGLRDAGFAHARCIEWDADACATLAAAGFPAWRGDVRDAAAYSDLPTVDLMWASPPCQDWSSAGKRAGADGDRNGWPWTIDAIDRVRPTWLLAENVPGLAMHTGACGSGCLRDPSRCPRTYFEMVLLPALRLRFAWVDWRELDAASYGTPQRRRRIFIAAGPRPITWPTPTHGDPSAPSDLFRRLKPWATVREALGLDSSGGDGHSAPPLWLRTEQGGAVAVSADEPSPTVPTMGNQYLHASDPGVRSRAGTEPHRIDEPSQNVTTTEVKGTRADHQRGGPDRASDALWLATGRRRLTVEECAVLQGFPPGYPFVGTVTSRYRQVGNAVVPKLAEMLGRAVLDADRRTIIPIADMQTLAMNGR